MFQAVVQGFASQFNKQSFLFICRDVAATEAFIQSQLDGMSLGLAARTDGQRPKGGLSITVVKRGVVARDATTHSIKSIR